MSRGTVVWITGRPAAGKSTLARALLARLRGQSRATGLVLLDGDEARRTLWPELGYTERDRERFYVALGRLAAFLARQGLTVVVAATAHRRAHREAARRLAPRFIEVHVDVPEAVVARRDRKGLYTRARAGRIRGFPGTDDRYEPPRRPAVTASGGRDRQALSNLARRISPARRPRQ